MLVTRKRQTNPLERTVLASTSGWRHIDQAARADPLSHSSITMRARGGKGGWDMHHSLTRICSYNIGTHSIGQNRQFTRDQALLVSTARTTPSSCDRLLTRTQLHSSTTMRARGGNGRRDIHPS